MQINIFMAKLMPKDELYFLSAWEIFPRTQADFTGSKQAPESPKTGKIRLPAAKYGGTMGAQGWPAHG
jgi:hypothetical protein